MSAEWIIYLAEVSGCFKIIFSLLSLFFFVLLMFAFMEYCDRKCKMFIFAIAVIFAIPGIFIPSEKTCHLIAAAKVSKEILQGSPVPEKILKLLNKKLDEELKEDK